MFVTKHFAVLSTLLSKFCGRISKIVRSTNYLLDCGSFKNRACSIKAHLKKNCKLKQCCSFVMVFTIVAPKIRGFVKYEQLRQNFFEDFFAWSDQCH